YRPALEPSHLVRTDEDATIAQGDKLSGERYLAAATIAEVVQANGGRCAVAGTKSAALLHNRNPVARSGNVTVFEGNTLPSSALAAVVQAIGPFPQKKSVPNIAEDAWTTGALTEVLWQEGVPEFSLLWMSEPDRAQHASGPGSPDAIAGIKSADANLAVVIRALAEKKVLDHTDILVVSDHGFSTISRAVDLAALLSEAGFLSLALQPRPAARSASAEMAAPFSSTSASMIEPRRSAWWNGCNTPISLA
ncbi:MAG: alkaline phosphatase family protein, partial [Verrucomicrobiota bacterium]|nr:alkaline phosphatase family protein [Verrucomicrobiota bacterium]